MSEQKKKKYISSQLNHSILSREKIWSTRGTKFGSATKHLLTNHSGDKECPQWYIDDRRNNVDEPVWEERSDAQKQDVAGHVISVAIHLRNSNISTVLKGV